mmetsp:Transcript_17198/g.69192  ORF Transcript_17198/g.69192 Transcript_17198/m.69192 type:complete len:319 (+) Transcript_17198:145-1101(+)|eukprot:CAMPEP_0185690064 /NCGR_PEP_ID=MMETSP1164-20130828/885_1 /TAXON_ID=1104430 /ORGANISM="Chrysoreinhardia sp, Strain CCMP2950" /LENGTH=318 /DNA_ID=CAMNT_0028356615 /DNA_START=74 /DNA_END=1030 /DNA_ORIENTATION=+
MASKQSLKKAKECEAKGSKALTKFSFFGAGSSKYEDAAEAYDDAGKHYVIAKAYAEGGAAYERAAELHAKAKGEFEAATSHSKAAEAFQKAGEPDKCIAAYRSAVATFAGLGKCSMAANCAKKCAELVEEQAASDETQLAGAVEMYREAVDYYEAENRPQAAGTCREKIAYLNAQLGAYDDAFAAFDELGRTALQSNLGKFNAKKWFTNAVLCALAREDSVRAANKLSEYATLDYSFDGTREQQLCQGLIEAVDANDEDAVATAAAEYDKIKRLDPWMTKLLLKIKASVSGGGGEDGAAHLADEPPDEDEAEDLPDIT